MVSQRLLEFRLARGIDALPNNHGRSSELHPADPRGDNGTGGSGKRLAPQAGAGSLHFCNMRWRGTAASAHDPGSFPGDLTHPASEFLRAHVIAGLAVPLHRKSCIGVDYQGEAGEFPQFGHQSSHLLGPQPTV